MDWDYFIVASYLCQYTLYLTFAGGVVFLCWLFARKEKEIRDDARAPQVISIDPDCVYPLTESCRLFMTVDSFLDGLDQSSPHLRVRYEQAVTRAIARYPDKACVVWVP